MAYLSNGLRPGWWYCKFNKEKRKQHEGVSICKLPKGQKAAACLDQLWVVQVPWWSNPVEIRPLILSEKIWLLPRVETLGCQRTLRDLHHQFSISQSDLAWGQLPCLVERLIALLWTRSCSPSLVCHGWIHSKPSNITNKTIILSIHMMNTFLWSKSPYSWMYDDWRALRMATGLKAVKIYKPIPMWKCGIQTTNITKTTLYSSTVFPFNQKMPNDFSFYIHLTDMMNYQWE